MSTIIVYYRYGIQQPQQQLTVIEPVKKVCKLEEATTGLT